MPQHFDLLIKNATIIDGSGQDAFPGDIGIQEDRITAMGNLDSAEGQKTIDATGKTVTPGFIDPHSHGDMTILVWPLAEAYVMQGVTTIIGGNCGISPAPTSEIYSFSGWEYELMYELGPGYFSPVSFMVKFADAQAAIRRKYGVEIAPASFGDYLDRVQQTGISLNLYPVVGHNAIRIQTMGLDGNRPARSDEIERMQDMVRDAMESGAFGLGTGLDYPPGGFAETEEVIALAKAAGEYGGIYESHFRSFNLYTGKEGHVSVIDGIQEALRIGREASVRVQLSHMSPGYQTSPTGSNTMARAAAFATIAEIELGASQGVETAYDVLPNTGGGGCMIPHLADVFRPWVLQAGGIDQFVKNLGVTDFRAYLKKSIERGDYPQLDPKRLPTWMPPIGDCYRITESENTYYEGRLLSDIAREMGTGVLEAMFNLIKADPFIKKRTEMGNNESVKTFLNHPRAMPSSDGFCFDQTTEMDLPAPLNKLPHPNNFCYAVRYLTEYPQERLEDNIRQMTGFPAEWFGIKDRGILAKGKYADVVIFDNTALKTNENHVESRIYPDGIDYVIVNGEITREKKTHLGTRAGKVLRRTG